MIVGGSANLAGKAALGLVRLNATNGAPDPTFGAVGANGQVATSIGTPAINGYITGMALTGNLLAVSGRASDPAGLATIAARYYAVGFPPPPPPLPAASTTGIDQITSSSARVSGTVNANGTASTWRIEYGTTTAYGADDGATGDRDPERRHRRQRRAHRPRRRHALPRPHRGHERRRHRPR